MFKKGDLEKLSGEQVQGGAADTLSAVPDPAVEELLKRRQMGMKKGGSVSSASKRADGCAQRGKTKGKFV